MHRVIGIVLFVAVILMAWFWMDYKQFLNSPIQLKQQQLVYEVKPGSHFRSIKDELASLGILKSPEYFEWYARQAGQASKIRTGEYLLAQGMTPVDLLALLVSGKSISHSLTFIEGWTFKQIRAAIESVPEIQQSLMGLSDADVMKQLGHDDMHPEGRFYPDTYHFTRNTTDADILRRAFSKMHNVLEETWANKDPGLPLSTPYEALILASIIEKETAAPNERELISGVFTRRLRKGMLLQTDPTVIYGMGDDYKGNIRRKDLTQDTPYNTYVHKGLTPTPICMPGGDSIRAAVHPTDGESLYFVAKGNKGEHYFSSTLKEHNSAVRKYQLKR